MMDGENGTPGRPPNNGESEQGATQDRGEKHDVDATLHTVHIRGGKRTSPTLDKNHEIQNSSECPSIETNEGAESWSGWAEIENDPEIFTILVQEWGAENIHVEEVLDVSELPNNHPDCVLGLIFLSRYVAPDTTQSYVPELCHDKGQAAPWFANQISKFSCGTVSLMNILMNNKDCDLSETLSRFKQETQDLSAKERGLCLNHCDKFRDAHNSFATLLDRMIVDQILKEEFQAATRRSHAPKRKRGRKGRKKKRVQEDEDEPGNHFVSYVSTNTTVWRLDGMEAQPTCVGVIDEGTSWLDVASAALMQQIEEAIEANYEVSLMKVVKAESTAFNDVNVKLEKHRKQEDWAPFIEHMIRLHAEKGDLAQLLEV